MNQQYYCVVMFRGDEREVALPAVELDEAQTHAEMRNAHSKSSGWKAEIFPLPGLLGYLRGELKCPNLIFEMDNCAEAVG